MGEVLFAHVYGLMNPAPDPSRHRGAGMSGSVTAGQNMSKMYDQKAATTGIIGFFIVVVAFRVVDAIYPLRPYISKSVGTAICFIIGFVPLYAYVQYKNRHRGSRPQ